MKGAFYLTLRYLRDRPARTLLLVMALAVPMFLPAATTLLVSRYERGLLRRAAATPIVAGVKGNRFDLVLGALYFRRGAEETLPFRSYKELEAHQLGLAVPLCVRDTAQGAPVVGTTPEYYERRNLRCRAGNLPLQLGDVLVGANVARRVGVSIGDFVFSDPRELYDIARPPSLKMGVCGVLAESGTPDDDAFFVDLSTVWVLEGLVHGHDDAEALDGKLILGGTEDRKILSPTLIPHHEVTPGNVASFHHHVAEDALPLTAVLVFPPTERVATLLEGEYLNHKTVQVQRPAAVVHELLGIVFRVKAFLDGYGLVLAAVVLLLVALVLLLASRLRAAELRTLERLGCSRTFVGWLHAFEIMLVLGGAALLAGMGLWGVSAWNPDLSRWIA